MRRQSRLTTLKDIRRYILMGPEMCNFDNLPGSKDVVLKDGNGDVSEFIRSRTRLYRETWIIPALNRLIDKEEQAKTKRKRGD